MDEYDKMFFIMIIVIILTFSFVMFFLVLGYNLTKEACEEKGMEITGQLDCRDGDVYYEVYSKDLWGFDKGVNKYPKTEQ